MAASSALLASKIVITEEPPRIRSVPTVPTSVTAFLGVAERGPIGVPKFVTTFDEFVNIFGSFVSQSDLAIAVQGFFRNGGTQAWVVRTAHYSDITDPNSFTATQGQQDLDDRGGAPTAAKATSGSETFDLEPSEVLVVEVDNSGDDTLTFNAARATINGGATSFPVPAGPLTMTVEIDNGNPQVITFSGGETDINAALNVINSQLVGGGAIDSGSSTIDLFSDKRGTDSKVEITQIDAGLSTALGLSVTTANGTGNVGDIDAVTAQEVADLLTALPLTAGSAAAVGGKVEITSPTTGPTSEVEIKPATTATGLGFAVAVNNGTASGVSSTLRVKGKDPGTYINSFSVQIQDPTNGESDKFNLRVLRNNVVQETFPNLSMTDADDRYVETIINDPDNGSLFIEVLDLDSPATSPNDLPAKGTFSSWSGADDGLTGLDDNDFVGNQAGGTGLNAFDEVQDLRILVIPGRATSAVHNAMVSYCEIDRQGLCFAVLDPPENLTATGIVNYVENTAALLNINEFGAIYWPRIEVLNPSKADFGNTDTIIVPPSGHIAGVYARVDQSTPGGVYIQPAGTENGTIVGHLGFETDEVLDERKRDLIFPKRINPISQEPGAPRFIDGARTLKGDGNFPSIGERRGVIFIEASLKQALLFAKHRNNDRDLRLEVNRLITSFLLIQMSNGAFRSRDPEQAFFVDTSDQLNSPAVVFAGQLKARIGLATQKPAEFIILLISQDTRAFEESIS